MKVLLMGGRFDGNAQEISDPERTPYIETTYFPPISATEWRPDGPPTTTEVIYERIQYIRMSWSVTDERGHRGMRYVYTFGQLSPAHAFDRLLECYGPTKDERIKALEEEVKSLKESLREANMMIGNHHRARLGL